MASLAETLLAGAQKNISESTPDFQSALQTGVAIAQKRQQLDQGQQALIQKQSELNFKKLDSIGKQFTGLNTAKSTPEIKFRAKALAGVLNSTFEGIDPDVAKLLESDVGLQREMGFALESMINQSNGTIDPTQMGEIGELLKRGGPEVLDRIRQRNDQVRLEAGKTKRTALLAGQKEFKDVQSLRKELRADPVTKDSIARNSAFNTIQSTLGGKPSAGGDLAGIFAFMKMLDPGSTVREGEFANAQNAASIPDKIRNAYNNARKGERLNPKQRADFINQAFKIKQTQDKAQQAVNARFSSIATQSGFDPSLVVEPINFSQKPKSVPKSDFDRKAEAFRSNFGRLNKDNFRQLSSAALKQLVEESQLTVQEIKDLIGVD